MEGKYLINTDSWFTAPDGREYKAVWGNVKVIKTIDIWGFEPNRPSQNWFLRVGNSDHHVLIAGCQIHYAIKCENKPYDGPTTVDYGEGEKTSECRIYFPEDYDKNEKPKFPADKHNDIGFMNIFRKQNGED